MNLNQYIAENFVEVPGIGYVAKQRLKSDRLGLEQNQLPENIRTAKDKTLIGILAEQAPEITRLLGSRTLTPAEYWRILTWAEHNSPELYENMTHPETYEILDGVITNPRIEEGKRIITLKLLGKQEREIQLPNPDSIFVHSGSFNFNRQDIDSETGFPQKSTPDGEYDFYFPINTIGNKQGEFYIMINPLTSQFCADILPIQIDDLTSPFLGLRELIPI